MNYISLCSGIEAATAAWHDIPGFHPVAFSEVDKHASAVLAHHYPNVPNLGDMTAIEGADYHGRIDLAVAGTPCQGFSVAGLRRGLADDRSNLCLSYVKFVLASRPKWILWENVPGVFSSKGGEDFSCFLSALSGVDIPAPGEGWRNSGVVVGAEGFYSLAWRVLDAQHFGIPQRRRRVFVVGHINEGRWSGWTRAAAVLFERHSLSGHPPPSREARKVAPTIPSRRTAGGGLGTDFDCDGGLVESSGGGGGGVDVNRMVAHAVTCHMVKMGDPTTDNYAIVPTTAHSLRADGFDASEDGTGRGTPLVPVAAHMTGVGYWKEGLGTLRAREQDSHENVIAFDTTQITSALNYSSPKAGDPCHPLASGAHPPAIAFSGKDYGADASEEVSPTLHSMGHDGSHANAGGQVAVAYRTAGDGAVYEEGHQTAPITTATDPSANIVTIQNALRGKSQNGLGVSDDGSMYTLDQGSQHAVAFTQNQVGDVLSGDICHSLGTNGNATGRNAANGDIAAPLTASYAKQADSSDTSKGPPNLIIDQPAIGWSEELTANDVDAGTIQYGGQGGRHDGVMTPTMAVRRLTPEECESLQGFPRGYTKIHTKMADGPRYKMLGNSFAVPVVRWIGMRLQMVDELSASIESQPVAPAQPQ